jgi:xanthine/CO dehydrogenase XdhC/CoxF family maturation factor
MEDRFVHEALLEAAQLGRPLALATVIRTRGSVPRHAGSRMLIDLQTGPIGTIGGGCGEADVLEAAKDVIASGAPRLVRVELMDAIDSWSPAVCGGVMEIFVEPVAPSRGQS